MNIAFRVDASYKIGSGHVIRCLVLADALMSQGCNIVFLTRKLDGYLAPLIMKRGFEVIVLDDLSTGPEDDVDCGWLTVTQERDALQTLQSLRGRQTNKLVVDHYSLDIEWETLIRPHVETIVVIDDLADRNHDCDVLIDQSFRSACESPYFGLVPADCVLLLGPQYAILDPQYLSQRKNVNFYYQQPKRVLVYFGGTDWQNMTGCALSVLSDSRFSRLSLDVVIGPNYPFLDDLMALAERRPNTLIHKSLPNLVDLMLNADVAIGAGGTTALERLCMGLPSFVITLADNQVSVTRNLDKAGYVTSAGHYDEVDHDIFMTSFESFLDNLETNQASVVAGSAIVDGMGVERLTELLVPSESEVLDLRKAKSSDVHALFNWVNERAVRQGSFNSTEVGWITHCQWFSEKLSNPSCCIFVLEARGLPIGQIRFDIVESKAFIDYSLDPIVRGRGWGREIVRMGVDSFKAVSSMQIVAEVKLSNKKSGRIFSSLGFREELAIEDDYRVFTLGNNV